MTRNRVARAYDWAAVSPSVAVIDAIARFEGKETPRMADQLAPLAAVLDPDALDALITQHAEIALEFEYAGYHIHLENNTVTVTTQPPTTHS